MAGGEIDYGLFPLDWKLDKTHRIPESFRDALIHVNDTLEFAWASAKQNFKADARPEHALEICKMVMAENERLQLVNKSPMGSDTEGDEE